MRITSRQNLALAASLAALMIAAPFAFQHVQPPAQGTFDGISTEIEPLERRHIRACSEQKHARRRGSMRRTRSRTRSRTGAGRERCENRLSRKKRGRQIVRS